MELLSYCPAGANPGHNFFVDFKRLTIIFYPNPMGPIANMTGLIYLNEVL